MDLLHGLQAMARPESRAVSARAFGREIGADDLIVFVGDSDIGQSLPAPGFPQTLREGRLWRVLIDAAIAGGASTGTVVTPEGETQRAYAIGLADGTVAVLLGGDPKEEGVAVLRALLPLLGALFHGESVSRRAQADSVLARQSASQSGELALKPWPLRKRQRAPATSF